MVCNDIPYDIPERDPPRTYVLCENRSSIQSLVLMRSAIIMFDGGGGILCVAFSLLVLACSESIHTLLAGVIQSIHPNTYQMTVITCTTYPTAHL